MKALLVNHTSTISGGEHSLLELLRAMPDGVDAVLACPEGPLAEEAHAIGIRVERLPKTDGSLKLHPWHTAKGVSSLVSSALAIRRLSRRHGADVVHANSIRAGLSATLASRLGGPPAVVHVRDCLPEGRVPAATTRFLRRRAAAIVANSSHTLQRFGSPEQGVVVHNPVDTRRFDCARIDRADVRRGLGLEPDRVVVGVVAQLTPWKGQDDAIRATALLKASGVDVTLLLVGSAKFTTSATRHDNITYVEGLHELARSLDVEREVRFLGERGDIPEILAALDLVLLPSWEEPFGRAVIEAFAMGVPVVATDVGGTCEIVSEGEDGLLRPPRRPDAWADAIRGLVEAPELLETMGGRARQKALQRFAPEGHGAAIQAVYERVGSANGDRLSEVDFRMNAVR
jgi:glycosyltransferase involved in cell wall biosynthesis